MHALVIIGVLAVGYFFLSRKMSEAHKMDAEGHLLDPLLKTTGLRKPVGSWPLFVEEELARIRGKAGWQDAKCTIKKQTDGFYEIHCVGKTGQETTRVKDKIRSGGDPLSKGHEPGEVIEA